MHLYADATLINQVPKAALVPGLRQALGASTMDTFWSPWTDILLWVLCTGLHAAEDMPEVKVAEFLQIREWEEVAPVLREFFYLDRVHGPPLQRLWREVKQVSIGSTTGTGGPPE